MKCIFKHIFNHWIHATNQLLLRGKKRQDLQQEHTRTTTKNSRISRLSNNSSLLSHYTNQLISRHEPWSEVTLHFLCSFAPPHLCLPGEARLKNQPQVMRFRAETGKRRAKLKLPRGPCMGGSSNLVYPEVPLQQNRSKTSVHFPGEWGWSWPEGVVRWQTDWKPNLMSEWVRHRSNLRWEEKRSDG